MDTPSVDLRTIVAGLILMGDYQELMNVYQSANLAMPPEMLTVLYGESAFESDDREALGEIRDAIHEDLLPDLTARMTVPVEMVELLVRCAFERGNETLALRAMREAGTLDSTYKRLSEFALQSLKNGDLAQGAYELRIAGRIGWARASDQDRLDFAVALGIDPAELAYTLGGESNRGRISGGRALPDFPALQTVGPLLHARCKNDTCIASLAIDDAAPRAMRLLLHDPELTEQAIAAVEGDAAQLLVALAAESDPELGAYADAYAQADARFREIEDITRGENVRDESRPDAEPEGPRPELTDEEREEAITSGLEDVQTLLLGHREGGGWRNCMGQLAVRHPLSLFTVCVRGAPGMGHYVVPVGENGTAFLKAVCGE